MEWRRFMFFNLLGAVVWAIGLTLAGWWLGRLIPPEVLDKYFTLIILAVIVLSTLPTVIHVWKEHGPEIWNRLRPGTRREGES